MPRPPRLPRSSRPRHNYQNRPLAITEYHPCGILRHGSYEVIGGQKIGFPDRFETDFVANPGGSGRAYVGIRFRFPRHLENQSFSGTEDVFAIVLRFPAGTFSIINLSLGDGQTASVDGLGPALREDTDLIDSYINVNQEAQGWKTLRDIFSQRQFRILARRGVQSSTALEKFAFFPSSQNYPYSHVLIPANSSKTQYPERFEFDNTEDALTAMTQSVVQDAYWFYVDVREIRGIRQRAFFLKQGSRSTEDTDSFFVLITLTPDIMTRFSKSVKRITKLGRTMHVWLDFGDGTNVARRRVDAVNNALSVADPEVESPSDEMDNNCQDDTPERLYHRKLYGSFLRDFFVGRGLGNTLLNPPTMDSGDVGTHGLNLSEPSLVAPKVDILGPINAIYREALLEMLKPGSRETYKSYLESVVLGLVGIFGEMESCTSEVLAVTALLYMGNPDIKTVHAAAWRNEDVTKFARCLHSTASSVVRSMKDKCTSAAQPHIPLIVRGCNIHSEVESFIKMIQGDLLIWDPRHWSRPFSLCEWLLKIVQHDRFDLDQLDRPELLEIRHKWKTSADYVGLRAFVNHDIEFWQVKEFDPTHCPDNQLQTATLADFLSEELTIDHNEKKDKDSSSSDATLNDENVEEEEGLSAEEQAARLKKEVWPHKLIQLLMIDILDVADALCTTPHVSRDAPYDKFWRSAGAVVFDEATHLSKSDAVIVWGNTMRPCAMAGKEGQTPWSGIDPFKTHEDGPHKGDYYNRFGPEAKVSALDFMRTTGWPCFKAASSDMPKFGEDMNLFHNVDGGW
ncbi:hypothetical protein K4K49_002269 [Colletotrichum sp. SAR 10_70]|nr:hypothetical protein K4K50_001141 [Colletotrichum sp. SAR 10_71]KAI8177062.1 hypothetical protein K4K49_002269 [Colletotrichum sp. SAR 10_70]KAI8217160.1 hypothetical protein K4K54_011935 [Colletotrichum sp. SAR 10_86]KAI8251472.1 hypothetical protein K4K53_012099 [Colletotrichum sp. SAR 10_77]